MEEREAYRGAAGGPDICRSSHYRPITGHLVAHLKRRGAAIMAEREAGSAGRDEDHHRTYAGSQACFI